jgi:FtsH-binding integral membrane protein
VEEKSMSDKAEKIIQGVSLTFKVLAGLMLFAGLMGYLIASLISILAQHSPLGPDSLFEQSAPWSLMLKNIGILATGQVIVAVFIFYASTQFSKLQAWARDALEFLAWFLLVFNIGLGVFLIVSSSLTSPAFLKSVVAVYTVLWTILMVILIWNLRKKEVREAYKK